MAQSARSAPVASREGLRCAGSEVVPARCSQRGGCDIRLAAPCPWHRLLVASFFPMDLASRTALEQAGGIEPLADLAHEVTPSREKYQAVQA
jgi:hypothetical protein